MIDGFAIFIISHGRPDNQRTLQLLHTLGSTERTYIVLDNQDDTIQQYVDNYGADNLIIFDKNHFVMCTDTGLNTPIFNFAVYARNAVEHIARELGLKTFLILDDDIIKFRYRYDKDGSLKSASLCGKFDTILKLCTDYILDNEIGCMSFGFCNSYRCGAEILYKEDSRQRFCAEAFIRNVDFPIEWRLNMVEDLITSIDASINGYVWFKFLPLQVEILMSEGLIPGGNSDAYNDFGKYRLSFMPTLVYPSFNIPRFINNHWVTTTTAVDSVPKLVSSKYKHHLQNM